MSGSKILWPSEVNAENIIKPTLDELSEDQRQAYEDYMKKRQAQLDAIEKKRKEDYEALRKKLEEKDTENFPVNYKKDRQGVFTPLGKPKLPPVISDLAEPSVSNVLFTSIRSL